MLHFLAQHMIRLCFPTLLWHIVESILFLYYEYECDVNIGWSVKVKEEMRKNRHKSIAALRLFTPKTHKSNNLFNNLRMTALSVASLIQDRKMCVSEEVRLTSR